MSAQPTPGPWSVERRGEYDAVIATPQGGSMAAVYASDLFGNKLPLEANARLIASAPALLAACEAASTLLDAYHGALAGQITDTELASLHNATAQTIAAAIAAAKEEA